MILETTCPRDGVNRNPFGFAGEYTDSETGLVYLRARYYDPVTGQFLTRDPLASSSQSPYGYVNGDPANATDPTGLWKELGSAVCAEYSDDYFADYLLAKRSAPCGFVDVGYQPLVEDTDAGFRALDPYGKCSALGTGDTGRSFDFADACDTHDYAYDLLRFRRDLGYGSGWRELRRHADRQLSLDMKCHCEGRGFFTKTNCRGWATSYYSGVKFWSDHIEDYGAPGGEIDR